MPGAGLWQAGLGQNQAFSFRTRHSKGVTAGPRVEVRRHGAFPGDSEKSKGAEVESSCR